MKFSKIIKFILIQAVIIIVFLSGYRPPWDAEDCTTLQIVVEDKELELTSTVGHATYKFMICSNGEWYEFPHEGIRGEYTAREMYEKINVGDSLEITYVKDFGFGLRGGEYNKLVDAINDSDVYLDFDSYNSRVQSANTTAFIVFAIFDAIVIFFWIVPLLL